MIRLNNLKNFSLIELFVGTFAFNLLIPVLLADKKIYMNENIFIAPNLSTFHYMELLSLRGTDRPFAK